jgi:hypothetical protein
MERTCTPHAGERSVHSRTPVLLSFQVTLPWHEDGGESEEGWGERPEGHRQKCPLCADVKSRTTPRHLTVRSYANGCDHPDKPDNLVRWPSPDKYGTTQPLASEYRCKVLNAGVRCPVVRPEETVRV